MNALFRVLIALLTPLIFLSCGTPPSLNESAISDCRAIFKVRADSFRSAAYLIDLRVNNAGKKYSVMTELVFSGDSIGLYGRGYLGRGAFKGYIIRDTIVLYFASENEYYSTTLTRLDLSGDCARGGEAMLFALSLLSGWTDPAMDRDSLRVVGNWASYKMGRFTGTLLLTRQGYPRSEVLTDNSCHDSINISYGLFESDFPFYQTLEFVAYSLQVG